MSGGGRNYVCWSIQNNLCEKMYDDELNDLMEDLVDLAHDVEWADAGDISDEEYWETVKKFKQKWFLGDRTTRLKGYCDKRLEQMRAEVYRLLGVDDERE